MCRIFSNFPSRSTLPLFHPAVYPEVNSIDYINELSWQVQPMRGSASDQSLGGEGGQNINTPASSLPQHKLAWATVRPSPQICKCQSSSTWVPRTFSWLSPGRANENLLVPTLEAFPIPWKFFLSVLSSLCLTGVIIYFPPGLWFIQKCITVVFIS